jgi:hypothetical protein
MVGSLAHSDFICRQGYPLFEFLFLENFIWGVETVYAIIRTTSLRRPLWPIPSCYFWRDGTHGLWEEVPHICCFNILCVGFGLCLYNGLWDMRDDLITGFETVQWAPCIEMFRTHFDFNVLFLLFRLSLDRKCCVYRYAVSDSLVDIRKKSFLLDTKSIPRVSQSWWDIAISRTLINSSLII